MDGISDHELVEAVRRGDPDAFPQLRERYQTSLQGYLRGCGIRRGPDCDDVAQEVWLGVWQAILKPREAGGYDPKKGTFYTWMLNFVAQYKVKDWWGRQGRLHPTFGVLEGEEGDSDVEVVSEAEPLSGDDIRLRAAAFSELFRLFWQCGGYPHEQIAFTLAKLVHGGESTRGAEGSPQRVDKQYGAERLGVLIEECWTRYGAISGLARLSETEDLRRHMEPARIRLALTVGVLIRPLPDQMFDLKDNTTDSTCLRDYYPKKQAENQGKSTHPISYWCVRVEQKVRHVLGLPVDVNMNEGEMDEAMGSLTHDGGGWPIDARTCGRCKLHSVSPCADRKKQSVACGVR